MKYKVVETFVSINGEGQYAGELSLFIRMKGCNLNCVYCDTKWANLEDAKCQLMTKEEIINCIKESKVSRVTLTGGEPLLRDGMHDLLEAILKDTDVTVEIETNGSVDIRLYRDLGERVIFTIDYKMPDSGMEAFMCMDNYGFVSKKDTVKMVVASIRDLEKGLEIIKRYDLIKRCHVYFSPVFGAIDPKEIVEFMKEKNLNGVRLQLQLHKFIWDPEEKGV